METKKSKGKEIKIPGPDHPITIPPTGSKVRVTVAGKIVAESTRALRLDEEGYPPVYYLPRDDADMSLLAQLWHTGAILLDGAQPVSASNVDPGQISVTRKGRKPTVTPRPLTKSEIQVTVADFARAARNAMEAGFDGVQILANYLYLISQFLNATTNLRKDEYGGSLENRSRFLFEVVESVLGEVDAQRVGVKISPMHESNAFKANEETLPVTEFAIRKLSTYDLSHLLIMGNTTDFSGTPLEKLADDGMFRHFRPLFKGTLIANVKMDRDRGNRLIAKRLADLVAFGRPYIANPDLVQRFRENAPLAEVDWDTVYGSGRRGYSDYPTYQPSELTRS